MNDSKISQHKKEVHEVSRGAMIFLSVTLALLIILLFASSGIPFWQTALTLLALSLIPVPLYADIRMREKKLLVSDAEALFTRLKDSKNEKGTLWFGITGSWRKTSAEEENDVREAVRKIIARGDGIVSGGALGVDYFATDEALKLDPGAAKIKVFLPLTADLFFSHYRKREQEGVITPEQAESVIALLEKLMKTNRQAVVENFANTVADKKTYFERNTEVVNASDALFGFQVNESEGTGDTVNKALAEGKPVCLKKYQIE
jgi:hypothetical protein